ncbi:MAG: two-component system sensor histidine kinase BaeS, partial [Colwellia sp.]
ETGGFGLGLSICQNIVIAHQGEIRAEKSSLGGLTITITLPLA